MVDSRRAGLSEEPQGDETEPQINADGRRLNRNEMSQLTEKVIRCAIVIYT